MSYTSSRRGLLIVGFLILALMVLLDLVRTDSVLKGAWAQLTPDPVSPREELRRTIGVPRR